MTRETVKKILKVGIGVIVTVASVTVEVLGELLRKKPGRD